MQRNFLNNLGMTVDKTNYFVGDEIEHTPNFGLRTLFIVGDQDMYSKQEVIKKLATENNCQHLFFGANHSFTTRQELQLMEFVHVLHNMSKHYKISIDVPADLIEKAMFAHIHEVKDICIQIRFPIPNVLKLNKFTQIKVDDRDFKATNPGVWTVPLTSMLNEKVFTPWDLYDNDEPVPGA